MEGACYNRSSHVQGDTSLLGVQWFARAAGAVPLPDGLQPVVIADYGAATGRNSVAPVRAAIAAIRQRAEARAISVVHTDLPESDFSALFHFLRDDPESYLHGADAVFAAAVGRSFYEQILPAGSVALGWSSWAVQWLSRVPAAIPDHVQVAYSRDAATRAAFAQQADADWRQFLRCRGREMCAGGQLVVLTMASRDDGDFGYRAVMRAMQGGLQALVGEGVLRAAEVARMTIPTVGRTRAAFLAPFGEGGTFGGLRVVHCEMFDGADGIWARFAEDGDAPAFGARWAAFSRASVFPTLARELDGGEGDVRAAVFRDRLEALMAEDLARAPEPMVIPLALVVLQRG